VDPSLRVVTRIPLTELWDERKSLDAHRGRYLTREELHILMRGPSVRFVVADVGHKLRWIPEAERFVFWKAELRPHLVENPDHIDVDRYPEGLGLLASEWISSDTEGSPIVLLERYH